MAVISGMTDLRLRPGCRIRDVTRPDASSIQIAAEARQRASRCPDCGKPSHVVHSRTVRRPADLPCLGREVCLELALRRLYCRNPACSRRTFVERLPGLIAPRAQRTDRLATAQGRVGVAMGGAAGARMLQRIGMPTSGDTVRRLVRRLPPILGRPPGPARRTSAFPRSQAERAGSADSRARWKALYDEVRRRIAAGEPLLTIGRCMGLARGTVRKFADAESFPERAVRPPAPSSLDPYLDGTAARLDFLPAVNAWWAAKGDIFDRVDGAFPTTRA
jgi:zinc-finger of transposase IS204/IS1001/IS1096/IS1165